MAESKALEAMEAEQKPSTRIRILWFNHRDIMSNNAGGAERSIMEIGRRLAKIGFDIHLASVNQGNMKAYEEIEGIKIHRSKSNIKAHISVRKTIRDINPDIIIDDMAHVVPWLSASVSKKPVIVFFHHLHARTLQGQVSKPMAFALKRIEKMYKIFYRDSIFITESETSANDLETLGIKPGNIRRILPGVDHALFKPAKKTDACSLVYFSGMRNYKRPWLAVEAFDKAKELYPDASIKVIGAGPSLNSTIEAAKRSVYTKDISFMGRISAEEVSANVSSSWVNLQTSMAEGFGVSMLEAAACGTPTIAIKAPGVSEIVERFHFGKTIESMEEFDEAFKDVCENIGKFSEEAYKSAMAFSWDACASEWASTIRSALQK